ncbi:MAG: hypothetical protein FWH01_15780 [Oscillospiraceae bacterium]|nr:hypothetical protein [Oscillospiraceae bacterium]
MDDNNSTAGERGTRASDGTNSTVSTDSTDSMVSTKNADGVDSADSTGRTAKMGTGASAGKASTSKTSIGRRFVNLARGIFLALVLSLTYIVILSVDPFIYGAAVYIIFVVFFVGLTLLALWDRGRTALKAKLHKATYYGSIITLVCLMMSLIEPAINTYMSLAFFTANIAINLSPIYKELPGDLYKKSTRLCLVMGIISSVYVAIIVIGFPLAIGLIVWMFYYLFGGREHDLIYFIGNLFKAIWMTEMVFCTVAIAVPAYVAFIYRTVRRRRSE